MASAFDDNILQEILSWLPAKFLGRLKTVSKRFRDLISDPLFISVQAQRSIRNISGILSISGNNNVAFLSYTSLYESRHDEFMDTKLVLPSCLILKAACNGLILYQLEEENFFTLYNPSTKVIIDRIPINYSVTEGTFGLAFDPVMCPARFKIVIIDTMFDSYHFTIYDPELGWRRSNNNFDYKSGNRFDWMLIQSVSPVFIRRTLHWLTKGGAIVAFNVDTENSWLVPPPLEQRPSIIVSFYSTLCLGVSEGYMTMLNVGNEGQIIIWNLVDWENGKWELKHQIRLQEKDSTGTSKHWKTVPLLYDGNICVLLRWVEMDWKSCALAVCRMDGQWYRIELSFWMDRCRRFVPFISHMFGESQKD